MSHQALFQNLQHMLAEWREERLLFPPLLVSHERFRAVTIPTLRPLIEAMATVLQDAGLQVEVSVHTEEEPPHISLYVAQYEGLICLWPDATDPTFLRMSAQGGYLGEAPLEWSMRYGLTAGGRLDRHLHEAVQRLLEARRER